MVRPKVILLVEDIEDDAELTRRALTKCKVANEVVHVRDGAEAIQWLFGTDDEGATFHNELPSLILLDLKLPRVSGLDVLKRIRQSERTKHLPVVILTSSKEEDDITNGYDNGCNSYIRKPVDSAEFNQAVVHVGLYWLLINEPPVEVKHRG